MRLKSRFSFKNHRDRFLNIYHCNLSQLFFTSKQRLDLHSKKNIFPGFEFQYPRVLGLFTMMSLYFRETKSPD